MMKAINLVLFFALLCFGAAGMVKAQELGQPQSGVQISTDAVPGTVSDLGIKNYLLGPGDTLEVRIFQQPDLSSTTEVDAEGNIRLHFIPPVRAQCRTEKDDAQDIVTAYAKFLQNPQVSVRITGRNSRPPAIVHGAVRQPQRIQMMRDVRLNELIAVTGGITERANGSIQVLHTSKVLCPAPGQEAETTDITAFTENGLKLPYTIFKISDLAAGKAEANPVIRPGDVVTVMEAEPVYITGSVINPQGLYLRDKLVLSRAIAMVGGFRKEAKTSDVRIYRQKPGTSEQEIIRVDYAAIKKGQKEDVLLQPYDVIEVQENGPFSGPRIVQTLMSSIMNVVPTTLTRGVGRVIY
jgi:polysaccharide export outer membrane protein